MVYGFVCKSLFSAKSSASRVGLGKSDGFEGYLSCSEAKSRCMGSW
jgi:hypothetical protein